MVIVLNWIGLTDGWWFGEHFLLCWWLDRCTKKRKRGFLWQTSRGLAVLWLEFELIFHFGRLILVYFIVSSFQLLLEQFHSIVSIKNWICSIKFVVHTLCTVSDNHTFPNYLQLNVLLHENEMEIVRLIGWLTHWLTDWEEGGGQEAVDGGNSFWPAAVDFDCNENETQSHKLH